MGFKVVEDRPTPREVYGWRVYLTAVVIAMGAALFGYCASFIGTTLTLPAFERDFGLAGLSASQKSMTKSNIVSVFQAGAFFGALAGYPSMELIGRKPTLIATALVFNVGSILQVAATNQIGMIYAGRVICGLAVGTVTTVAPPYLAETSPPAIRGRLVGFYEIGYQLMAVVGFWIVYGIKKHMDLGLSSTWRIPMAVQLIPGGILLAGCFFLVESPRYLLKRGNSELAIKNLCWLRNLPENEVYIQQELSSCIAEINREREVTFGQKGSPTARYARGLWKEATSKGIRNRLIIGAFIMMWQNMSGVNSLNYYSPSLFASIGIADVGLYTGIYGVLKALASLVFFSFLVDTWGRRSPLMWGATSSGLCLLFVGVYIKVGDPVAHAGNLSASTAMGGQAATAFVLLFGITYCLGWNGLAWVICAEIYPTRIRGACAAWTAMWQWVFQFIIARTTEQMSESLGWGMFLLFTCFNIASAVFVFFFIPETKGKTLEQMDEIFGYVRDDLPPSGKATVDLVEDMKAVPVPRETV